VNCDTQASDEMSTTLIIMLWAV